MEVHHFRYVLAVAKYKSFSLASQKMNITQSGLSQQIMKLEKEIGIPLFQRNTRTVRLTEAGKTFCQFAESILSQVDAVTQTMKQFAGLKRGKIMIGTIPILGYLGIASVIAEFYRRYPQIQLEFYEGGSREIVQWLEGSRIDFGILTPPTNMEHHELTYHPIFEDEVVLITHLDHPLANKKRIHLKEVAEEPFIFMRPSYGMTEISVEACKQAGFTPNVIYQSSQVETIHALVKEGLGVSLLTRRVVKHFLEPSVSMIRLNPTPSRATAIATRSTNLTPAVKALRDHMVRHPSIEINH